MAFFASGGAERPPHDNISQKSPCKIGLKEIKHSLHICLKIGRVMLNVKLIPRKLGKIAPKLSIVQLAISSITERLVCLYSL